MDSVDVLAKLAAIEGKLVTIERELIEVVKQTRSANEFIDTMKEVVSEMSNNPMFKALGIPNLSAEGKQDIPRLPGMPRE